VFTRDRKRPLPTSNGLDRNPVGRQRRASAGGQHQEAANDVRQWENIQSEDGLRSAAVNADPTTLPRLPSNAQDAQRWEKQRNRFPHRFAIHGEVPNSRTLKRVADNVLEPKFAKLQRRTRRTHARWRTGQ